MADKLTVGLPTGREAKEFGKLSATVDEGRGRVGVVGETMRIGSTVIVAISALISITGCSPSPPSGAPTTTGAHPVMIQSQLCDALKNFFTDDLRVVDVRTTPTLTPGSELKVGGICEVQQGQNPAGHYQARPTLKDLDPTEGRNGYKKAPELGDSVWVFDRRTDERNPSGSVRFATRIKEWNAILEVQETDILTAGGPLHLTDDDKRACVRFLTDMTTQLAN